MNENIEKRETGKVAAKKKAIMINGRNVIPICNIINSKELP